MASLPKIHAFFLRNYRHFNYTRRGHKLSGKSSRSELLPEKLLATPGCHLFILMFLRAKTLG
ncbi:MAG: hypothetical protein DRQ99_30075 [Candidatus Parabeggiatoa sp. nov. 3]|nr:MAG: hypothetical protein DRQ99_30075 [Gammaproteobacteria bacterium]